LATLRNRYDVTQWLTSVTVHKRNT